MPVDGGDKWGEMLIAINNPVAIYNVNKPGCLHSGLISLAVLKCDVQL